MTDEIPEPARSGTVPRGGSTPSRRMATTGGGRSTASAQGHAIPSFANIEAALVASSIGYSLTSLYAGPWLLSDVAVLLALTLGVMARAVFIPSSAARTVWLTTSVGLPVLAVLYWAVLYWDGRELPLPRAGGMSESDVAVWLMTGSALWWLLTVILCAVTSTVVHGLREQARTAERLGQYTLEEKLGEGGMGVVYRARHSMLRRPAAVKLLRPEKTGEETLARFEQEVQLTARLTHPNTVTVFDYGRTSEGTFYYAMELLDGATIEQIIAAVGPQSSARVVEVLSHVACALSEAHDIGLVHRDIKPANIVLCNQGGVLDVPKVLDFGLVKDLEADGDLGITQANVITGTPLYLAPEAIRGGGPADPRSDLYALGAVAYYMVTGKHVFEGASVMDVCTHHLHTEPIRPSKRAGLPIPRDVEHLILSCLEKDPADRPQSAREVRRRLEYSSVMGQWRRENAEEWWERWGPSFRDDVPSTVRRRAGMTLPVDMARRSG